MHVLFVHRAFPAQFGQLALKLSRRYGWKCSCMFQHLSRCPSPTPEMLQCLELCPIQGAPDPRTDENLAWPQNFGRTLEIGRAVFETVRVRGLHPDLVVGHGGLTATLLLRDLLDCPLVDYCEYYFAPRHRDLTYRVDLPAIEAELFYPRCINAATLLNLSAADSAYTPTAWQRQSFPERFQPKIEVHFDGVDTELYRPGKLPRVLADQPVSADTRIVTFAARGLESVRGFDIFLNVARRILRERNDVMFAVAGDDGVYYGWDKLRTGGISFKEWALRRADVDPAHFVFLGHIEPAQLAEVLCLSDLHIYLTVPFVLSWSLFNALACGCTVLAGDVPPVREIIEPGRNGLLEPLFDDERIASTALHVLRHPADFGPLREAARAQIEQSYSLDVAVPPMHDYFERVGRRDARTAGALLHTRG
jgi:glycosyltransferase involved in cell wall biosynthesis